MKQRPPSRKRREERLTVAFRRIWREDALRAQDYACHYCEEPLTTKTVTADHEKARAVGGLDQRNNIIGACQPCNRLKGQMPVTLFMRRIRDPKPGDPLAFWVAWSRWRLNHRLALMARRLGVKTRGRP